MAYIAKLISTGGRDGKIKSEDGSFSLDIKHPVDGKQPSGSYNPELLLAGAAVACYNGAFLYHLEKAGKSTEGIEMHAEVQLKTDSRDKENMLSLKLTPVAPHLSKEEIKEFADKADKTCPYTKLFRGEAEYEIVKG